MPYQRAGVPRPVEPGDGERLHTVGDHMHVRRIKPRAAGSRHEQLLVAQHAVPRVVGENSRITRPTLLPTSDREW
jgi:hypothetical protein